MNDDELLQLQPAAPAPQKGLSDADLLRETMPREDVSDVQRHAIAQTSLGRVMDAAGEGAKHGWGARQLGLSDEARAALTGEHGSAVKDALTLPFRAFNGAVVVPAMTVLDGLMRSFGAASGAVAAGTGQVAKEAGMNEADANRLTRDLLRGAEVVGVLAGATPYVPHTRAARAAEAEARPQAKPNVAAAPEAPPPELLLDSVIPPTAPTPLLDKVAAGAPIDEVLATAVRTREGEFAGAATGRSVVSAPDAWLAESEAADRAFRDALQQAFVRNVRDYTRAKAELDKYDALGAPREIREALSDAADALVETAQHIGFGSSLDGGVRALNSAEDVIAAIGRDRFDALSASVAPGAAYTRPGEFAGNVNLGRIAMADETAQVYRDTAASAAERRVVTHAETEATARAMGITPEEAAKLKLAEGRTAAENTAIRQLVLESSTRVHNLKEAARTGDDAAVAAFLEAADTHTKLFDLLTNRTAEAGRTLSAMRITVAEGRTQAEAIAKAVKEFGGKKNVEQMIDALDKLDTPEQVAAFLNSARKAGWKDMALEGWRAFLLSGPQTQVRNLIGNSLNLAITVPESAIAGAYGSVARVLGREKGVYAGEAVQRSFGIASAVPDAARVWWRAIRDEDFSAVAGTVTQTEARAPQAIPGAAGKAIRLPFRVLNAFDQSFRTLAFEAEVRAQALRAAHGEGLSGAALTDRVAELIRNPSDDMREAGRQAALSATFQDPLTGFMAKADDARRSTVVAQFIVPFLRTPTNIMSQAFVERTPLGVLGSQRVYDNLLGRNGAVARDTQMARLTMGGMIGYTFFHLAEQGLVTGSAPKDANERAMMMLEGRPPMSVKIGDFWYEYNSGDPVATLVALAADAREVWSKLGTDEQDQIAAMIGMSISRQVLDKSWARGPSDLLDAVTDPQRHGDKWLYGQASSVVPSFLRQWARAEDPVVRDVRSVVDSLRASVPYVSQSLPAKRDIFGNEVRRTDKVGPDFVSPVGTARPTEDPVVQELARLRVYPAAVERVVQGIELDEQQYEKLAIMSGVAVRNALVPLVQAITGSDATDAPIPDGVRQELVVKAVRRAREQARTAFVAQHPEIAVEIMKFRLERLQ